MCVRVSTKPVALAVCWLAALVVSETESVPCFASFFVCLGEMLMSLRRSKWIPFIKKKNSFFSLFSFSLYMHDLCCAPFVVIVFARTRTRVCLLRPQ